MKPPKKTKKKKKTVNPTNTLITCSKQLGKYSDDYQHRRTAIRYPRKS